MYQPYIDIEVDGVMQRREAYLAWEWPRWTAEEPYEYPTRAAQLRPFFNDNERLIEAIDGRMWIVTIPLDN